MSGLRSAIPIVSTALCLAGCSGGSNPAHEFTTYLESGIELCVTSAGPKYHEQLFRYRKLATLQQDQARPETLLYGYSWMYNNAIIDGSGYIYFADEGNHRVMVYAPDGKLLRILGREGQGPGEFLDPVLVAADGNSVIAFEKTPNLQRLTQYTAEGHLLGVRTLPGLRMATYYATPVGGDTLVIEANVRRFDGAVSFLARNLSAVAGPDTLASLEYSLASDPTPFTGQSAFAVGPGGQLVLAIGDEPTIRWFDVLGAERRRFVLQIPAEEVTVKERNRVQQYIAESIRSSTNQYVRQYFEERAKLKIPLRKDWWSDVTVDSYGFTWAQEAWEMLSGIEPGELKHRVFSPSGEYLGLTKLPAFHGKFGLFDLSQGRLVLRYFDASTEEPVIEVWEILSNVDGLTYGPGG